MKPVELLESIKDQIRWVRVRDLTASCSVSQTSISRIMRGTLSPTISTLQELSDGLDRLHASTPNPYSYRARTKPTKKRMSHKKK